MPIKIKEISNIVTKITLGTQSPPHTQLKYYSVCQDSILRKNKALRNALEVYIISFVLSCIKYNVSCLKTIEKYLNWEMLSKKNIHTIYTCFKFLFNIE